MAGRGPTALPLNLPSRSHVSYNIHFIWPNQMLTSSLTLIHNAALWLCCVFE